MNEPLLPNASLQIFSVSRETSNCPLIPEMVQLSRELDRLGIRDDETGVISVDYGRRLLINAKQSGVKTITQQDVVEIVDYDPLKNIMMVIGPKDPTLDAPVHWIVQKARQDINALLQINSITLFKRFQTKLPTTENTPPAASLEQAKEILKTLQKGKTILIKEKGIVFAGININEIQHALRTYLEVRE